MALITLCPECKTTFRITPSLLKAHGGDVRCGKCNQVFNSFTTLITVNEAEINGPTNLVSAEELNDPGSVTEASSHNENNLQSPDTRDKPLSTYLTHNQADPPPLDPAHNFDADASSRRKHQLLSRLASLLALVILTGSVSYSYRAELALHAPSLRPHLERYCAYFSCVIPYPQELHLLNIESSDLIKDPTKKPGIKTLIATIRNYASFPQALPVIKLTLADVTGKSLASRNFTAKEYLNKKHKGTNAIEPNDEIDVKIDFETDETNVAGYQLFLIYQ